LRLESACNESIKSILERQLDRVPIEESSSGAAVTHDNIRGAAYFDPSKPPTLQRGHDADTTNRRETPYAATAADGNPVMMLIVCLLATASMADDRIAFTSGASPQDDFGPARGPIGLEQLVRRHRKWDKQNRTSSGLCPPALTSQDLSRKQSSFHLTKEIQLEENTASRLWLFRGVSRRIGR